MKGILTFLAGVVAAIVFYLWKLQNTAETRNRAARDIASSFAVMEEDEKEAQRQFREAVKERRKDIEKAKKEQIVKRFKNAFERR